MEKQWWRAVLCPHGSIRPSPAWNSPRSAPSCSPCLLPSATNPPSLAVLIRSRPSSFHQSLLYFTLMTCNKLKCEWTDGGITCKCPLPPVVSVVSQEAFGRKDSTWLLPQLDNLSAWQDRAGQARQLAVETKLLVPQRQQLHTLCAASCSSSLGQNLWPLASVPSPTAGEQGSAIPCSLTKTHSA